MFNPGETIVHSFIIPFVSTDISKVIVTYRNMDNGVFYVKEITSERIEPESEDPDKSVVKVHLTQDESLLFHEYDCFKIQLNVITNSNPPGRFSSQEIVGKTGPQHMQEVIS